MVVGVWLPGERYRIYEPGTDNEVTVMIPGADSIYDADELDEICHWQREEAEKEWQDKAAKVPLTRGQQHDLGGTLVEIRASKECSKENLHGRYW